MFNTYTKAFAIGYYYGRGCLTDIDMPSEDQAYQSHQGFKDGLAAGRNDFIEIDLPIAALSSKEIENA